MLPADPTVTPLSPPLRLNRVLVLESFGAPAEDTVARFPAASPRVLVLRRGAPDNGLFARVSFPAGSIRPRTGDTATVRVRIVPGLYGVEIGTDGEILPGAELTFSYGQHFVAPAAAQAAYGSDYRFERFLAVGRLQGDSTLVFLDSWRTASDLLTAPLPGPGRYLVAAPATSPTFRSIIW